MHSFQQDIRKTLTQYALIPVLVIALLGTVIGVWSWQHDVEERSVQAVSYTHLTLPTKA